MRGSPFPFHPGHHGACECLRLTTVYRHAPVINGAIGVDTAIAEDRVGRVVLVLADFVCSVQPGAANGVAFAGVDHVIEGEAGWQAGGLVDGEELEEVGVGPV
jgi:hypothetical protein